MHQIATEYSICLIRTNSSYKSDCEKTRSDWKCYFYLIIKIPRYKIVDYNLITANKYRTQSGCKTAQYHHLIEAITNMLNLVSSIDGTAPSNVVKSIAHFNWAATSFLPTYKRKRSDEKKNIFKLHKIIVERISIAWNVFSQMDFSSFFFYSSSFSYILVAESKRW